MSETTLPEIHKPSERRQLYIGGALTIGGFLWISALLVSPLVGSGDVPLALFVLIVTGAATSTVIAAQLLVSNGRQAADAENLSTVMQALGQLAAQQEQVSAKIDTCDGRLDKFDPWVMYTAAAADILGRDN